MELGDNRERYRICESRKVPLQQRSMNTEEDIHSDTDAPCDVCRSIYPEDGNEMVFCDSCNVCVHQACYGVVSIPEGNWNCAPCKLQVQPSCHLCPKKGGAMKRTSDGRYWCHIICAWWIPEVTFGVPERMEEIENILCIPIERWNLLCSLCRLEVGACIQCSHKKCVVAYHVTCAFKEGLRIEMDLNDNKPFKSFCRSHSRRKKTTPKKRKIPDSINEYRERSPSQKKPCMKEQSVMANKSAFLLKNDDENNYVPIFCKESSERCVSEGKPDSSFKFIRRSSPSSDDEPMALSKTCLPQDIPSPKVLIPNEPTLILKTAKQSLNPMTTKRPSLDTVKMSYLDRMATKSPSFDEMNTKRGCLDLKTTKGPSLHPTSAKGHLNLTTSKRPPPGSKAAKEPSVKVEQSHESGAISGDETPRRIDAVVKNHLACSSGGKSSKCARKTTQHNSTSIPRNTTAKNQPPVARSKNKTSHFPKATTSIQTSSSSRISATETTNGPNRGGLAKPSVTYNIGGDKVSLTTPNGFSKSKNQKENVSLSTMVFPRSIAEVKRTLSFSPSKKESAGLKTSLPSSNFCRTKDYLSTKIQKKNSLSTVAATGLNSVSDKRAEVGSNGMECLDSNLYESSDPNRSQTQCFTISSSDSETDEKFSEACTNSKTIACTFSRIDLKPSTLDELEHSAVCTENQQVRRVTCTKDKLEHFAGVENEGAPPARAQGVAKQMTRIKSETRKRTARRKVNSSTMTNVPDVRKTKEVGDCPSFREHSPPIMESSKPSCSGASKKKSDNNSREQEEIEIAHRLKENVETQGSCSQFVKFLSIVLQSLPEDEAYELEKSIFSLCMRKLPNVTRTPNLP